MRSFLPQDLSGPGRPVHEVLEGDPRQELSAWSRTGNSNRPQDANRYEEPNADEMGRVYVGGPLCSEGLYGRLSVGKCQPKQGVNRRDVTVH